MIKYSDKIYGEVIINDTIIIDLINSKEFEKLKNINQIGIPNELSDVTNFSRFEHSMGVYIILKKFKCTLIEQIIGLLHDVSHTAFSHTIDFVFGDSKTQSFQDDRYYNFIKNSSIGNILIKYGYDIKEISDLLKFRNVKTNDKTINADNLDYGLREISYNPKYDLDYAKECYNNIILDKKFGYIFKTQYFAIKFAKGFIDSRNYYEKPENTIKFFIFSKFLKLAYNKKIINKVDFNLTDNQLISKILSSNDDNLIEIYNILKSKDDYFNILNNDNVNKNRTFDEIIFTKYRYTKPYYFNKNHQLLSLIEFDKGYKDELEYNQKLFSDGFKFNYTNLKLKKLLL